MKHEIQELIENNGGNYILPFFWMHGEDETVIREEMKRMRDCSIQAVCVEARPHVDFLGDKWWRDMDIIMDEARTHNMKVWLLDDEHFPTGIANFAYRDHYPNEAKYYLAEKHLDILGPEQGASFSINPFMEEDGKLIAVLACPRTNGDAKDLDLSEAIDLSEKNRDGIVSWDVPDGLWRLIVIYKTQQNGGSDHYMNVISQSSVRILLDTVYEPHYQRYQKDFGKTFAGFFSDEPEFGNVRGYDFTEKLGVMGRKLPWSDELEVCLEARWGCRFKQNMPALWFEGGNDTPLVRFQYMDEITKLVSSCFSSQISSWCEDHSVEYIGHLIEDDNAHGRLGCSLGHYYRALSGQHMAGIDVVLLQIMPGLDQVIHQWIASDRDGEFFHYALAKLGSSHAHLDPLKQGRAMCEIFGAYGWAEDISLMKFLTDHMLIRGINYFVPHAFNPNSYPDPDCPPHFYTHNKNPQYRHFVRLMKYMNRMSHLLNRGRHLAQAAVLYHADAEWADEEAMLTQKPVKILLQNQIDCDIVSSDFLPDIKMLDDQTGWITINGETFSGLVVPKAKYWPEKTLAKLIELSEDGANILFIDSHPQDLSDRRAFITDKAEDDYKKQLLASINNLPVCKLDDLPEVFDKKSSKPIRLHGKNKWLRTMFYYKQGSLYFMIMNEHASSPYGAEIILNLDKLAPDINFAEYNHIYQYDAYNNQMYNADADLIISSNTIKIRIKLEAGQSKLFLISDSEDLLSYSKQYDAVIDDLPIDEYLMKKLNASAISEVLIQYGMHQSKSASQQKRLDISSCRWELYMTTNEQYPKFEYACDFQADEWPNLNDKDYYPSFGGHFRYKTSFDYKQENNDGKRIFIILNLAKDGTEVYLNNRYCGMSIAKPYMFEITDQIKDGENELKIDIANTLAWEVRDDFSSYMTWKHTGLRQSPCIIAVN